MVSDFVVWLPEPDALLGWIDQGQSREAIRDMLWWLQSLEHDGYPPIVGYGYGDGMPMAEGPNSELVEHLPLPLPLDEGPPYGAIIILKIYSLPTAPS
jgi:hypothetical protein